MTTSSKAVLIGNIAAVNNTMYATSQNEIALERESGVNRLTLRRKGSGMGGTVLARGSHKELSMYVCGLWEANAQIEQRHAERTADRDSFLAKLHQNGNAKRQVMAGFDLVRSGYRLSMYHSGYDAVPAQFCIYQNGNRIKVGRDLIAAWEPAAQLFANLVNEVLS